MNLDSWLSEYTEKGLLRELTPVVRESDGRLFASNRSSGPLYDFSSNDYLALATSPELLAKSKEFLETNGCGAGAARLMSGDLAIYHLLEEEVAKLKGQESALLFGSGYMANCGIIPALVGRNDIVFADRLNHASLYDGCHLSRAEIIRFRHNDMNHLEELLYKKKGEKTALVVVESLYSMDGDRCPLRDLISLKNRFGFMLMVDEAHATGVYGRCGGGIIEEEGMAEHVDIAMGTFGKALGSYGAYAAGTKQLIKLLINRARTFIYSTGLPPAVIGASLAAVRIVSRDDTLRKELFEKVGIFKTALSEAGLENLGLSQIIPIMIGNSKKAVKIADYLRKKGVFATAVRPPTVPEGSARLRFSITRHLEENELLFAARQLIEAIGALS